MNSILGQPKKDELRKYFESGGLLFSVLSIDKVRDGGNLAIHIEIYDPHDKKVWWCSKDNYKFYRNKPFNDDNILTKNELWLLKHRIYNYTNNLSLHYERIFDIISYSDLDLAPRLIEYP